MSERAVPTDRRGVSEAMALGVLIGMVVVSTGAVGVYVLVTGEEETTEVNFTFQYFDDTDAILITHSQGEDLVSGNVEVEGPDNTVTWAEAANDPEDSAVTVGDSIQLSRGNIYGSTILNGDTFSVYRNQAGNRTQITRWTAGS